MVFHKPYGESQSMSREMQSSHSHSFPFLSSVPVPVVFYNHNSPCSHFLIRRIHLPHPFCNFPTVCYHACRLSLLASVKSCQLPGIRLQWGRSRCSCIATRDCGVRWGSCPRTSFYPQLYLCRNRALLSKAVVRVSFAVVWPWRLGTPRLSSPLAMLDFPTRSPICIH